MSYNRKRNPTHPSAANLPKRARLNRRRSHRLTQPNRRSSQSQLLARSCFDSRPINDRRLRRGNPLQIDRYLSPLPSHTTRCVFRNLRYANQPQTNTRRSQDTCHHNLKAGSSIRCSPRHDKAEADSNPNTTSTPSRYRAQGDTRGVKRQDTRLPRDSKTPPNHKLPRPRFPFVYRALRATAKRTTFSVI